MMYLRTIIRTNLDQYKKRLFFKSENWKRVKDYAMNITGVQIELASSSAPEELEIIGDKLKFFRKCVSRGLPTPNVLATFSHGMVVYMNPEIKKELEGDLFIKKMKGGQGEGTMKLRLAGNAYSDREGNSFSVETLWMTF